MRRWWTKKYKLPPTDPTYLDYTIEELWLEYFEDLYEAEPNFQLEEEREDVVFSGTGDAAFDKVEALLAAGNGEKAVLAELEQWEGKRPPAQTRDQQLDKAYGRMAAARAEEEAARAIGDGFADEAPKQQTKGHGRQTDHHHRH